MPQADQKMRVNASAPYYILYFTERALDGRMGPLKRARFALIHEAVDHAHGMRHGLRQDPIEIRDQHDQLVTCALMGWRLSPLHRNMEPRFDYARGA
ncbi:hypothetical protein [Ancylobacter sp.]|uniref:hypothetical protein n=1 Tax=Ancylobacter sp. TaxID=1872567 RepID=UPI003D12E696